MSKYRHGKLYVRRYREGDNENAESFRTAVRCAYVEATGGGYVVARHGKSEIMEAARTKKQAREMCTGFGRTWKETALWFKEPKR